MGESFGLSDERVGLSSLWINVICGGIRTLSEGVGQACYSIRLSRRSFCQIRSGVGISGDRIFVGRGGLVGRSPGDG